MVCNICNETDVIKIFQQDRVKFECKNGHVWYEDYKDNGGTQERPDTYEIKLEDVLFDYEKELYNKILKELDSDKEFYINADPLSKINALINRCEIQPKDLYNLLRKVIKFETRRSNI